MYYWQRINISCMSAFNKSRNISRSTRPIEIYYEFSVVIQKEGQSIILVRMTS